MHMTGEVKWKRLCVSLVDAQLSEMFLFGVIVIQKLFRGSVLHNHS